MAILIALSLSLYSQTEADGPSSSELPFDIPDERIKPLRTLVDKDFQAALEKQLKKNKTWWNLISKKRLAIGLVDLKDPYNVRYAGVNRNQMMYAASLPKLAILLAAQQALEDSLITPTPAVLSDMRQMISKSNNAAATRMIDRVGFKYIELVLRKPEYELYDPNFGGGLWVGKRYAKGGKRYPDPVLGTSHGATVTQVCRFYYLLSMGKLVNRPRSKDMLSILSDPEIHHKFVATLDNVVPDATLYRKSGTWRNWHADSCMVWGPVWRRYIVVALVESPKGEQILRNLITEVEKVLKESQPK